MAKTRKNARARNTNLRVIENDPAALAAERANDTTAIDPTTPDETPAADKTIDAEALENNPDVVDSTENYTSVTEVESERPSEAELAEVLGEPIATTEPVAQEPAAPDVTDGGRLLASRFESSDEALAYAGNMKLRNYSISRQDDGQYAIEIRKQASNKPAAPQTTEGAVQAPARAAPKTRTPRAKASGPRPDTRNFVIWSMLTRPEGTTRKEVDAALAAFQPNNIQPCGIGSDAKLFAGRFGYQWRKEADGDATRYFCFLIAPVEPSEEGESDQEPVEASETESAAS